MQDWFIVAGRIVPGVVSMGFVNRVLWQGFLRIIILCKMRGSGSASMELLLEGTFRAYRIL